MKAIRVHEHGGPEVLRLEELRDPQPQAGQVVVQVRAAGVNPIDTYIRAGIHGYSATFPYTPGLDAAGIVESVGQEVTNVSVGARVYCAGTLSGAYAEKVVCHGLQIHPLPERLSFAQGACIAVPYGAAYRALFQRARSEPAETVLIHGASGGVGLAATQLARAAGLRVIGTAGTDQGRRLVLENGAHFVLDHHDPGHLERAVELTDGRGVDIILEMLANVNLGCDLPALAGGGRVVVVGCRGNVEINPRDTMPRETCILGMSLGNAPEREVRSIHAALVAGLESGTLNPVVGRQFPLGEAAQAHRALMEPGSYGNIVLVP